MKQPVSKKSCGKSLWIKIDFINGRDQVKMARINYTLFGWMLKEVIRFLWKETMNLKEERFIIQFKSKEKFPELSSLFPLLCDENIP